VVLALCILGRTVARPDTDRKRAESPALVIPPQSGLARPSDERYDPVEQGFGRFRG